MKMMRMMKGLYQGDGHSVHKKLTVLSFRGYVFHDCQH